MKKFHDQMTDEELLALTDADIDDCAKLNLIKDGEQIPYEEPTIPTLETLSADKVRGHVWQIGGFNFERMEDAQAVADIAKKSVNLDSVYTPYGYPNLDCEPHEGFLTINEASVTKKPYYAKEVANALAETLKRNAELKKPHDEWKAVMGKFHEARSQVLSAVYAAQARKRDIDQRKVYMDECLRLADNDQVIAKRFFEKRFLPPAENTDSDNNIASPGCI